MTANKTLPQLRMARGDKWEKVYNEVQTLEDRVDAIDIGSVNYLGDSDTDSNKIRGTVSTRNTADTSMYVPMTSTQTKCFNISYSINAATVVGSGYTDALFVDARVNNCTPTGSVRGGELKATISGDMGNSSFADGVYAKTTVSSSPAGQADSAAAVHTYMEATSPGAVTAQYGVYVEPGSPINATTVYGVSVGDSAEIDYALDVSGTNYKLGQMKVPLSSAAGKARANMGFGCTYNSTGAAILGLHKDTNDSNKVYIVVKDGSDFYYVLTTACGA